MKTLYGFMCCFVLVFGFVAMEAAKHFIEPEYNYGDGYFVLNICTFGLMVVSYLLGLVHSLLNDTATRDRGN